jgi:hypothetical protein
MLWVSYPAILRELRIVAIGPGPIAGCDAATEELIERAPRPGRAGLTEIASRARAGRGGKARSGRERGLSLHGAEPFHKDVEGEQPDGGRHHDNGPVQRLANKLPIDKLVGQFRHCQEPAPGTQLATCTPSWPAT